MRHDVLRRAFGGRILRRTFGGLVLCAIATSACVSTSTLVTERPGATVIRERDGTVLGQTPYLYQTTGTLFDEEKLRVVQGQQSVVLDMKRSEIDLLPYAGGMCLTLSGVGTCVGIPLLLGAGMKYPTTTKVEFASAKKKPSSTPSR